MDAPDLELFRQHRQGQDKYIYFLLAAVGAAIGFALAQTKGAALAWSQVPLGLAVLCWAGSFYAGCQRIRFIEASLRSNADLLQVEAGRHPNTGMHPHAIAIASSELRSIFEKQGDGAKAFATWQFALLVAGAGLYVVWHVVEMFLRRPDAARLLSLS